MSQKYFSALFKGRLNFELFWRINPQGKHAVKEVYNCFTFNAMPIDLFEIAYKIFEGKLYGKTPRISFK